jgi:hypothetical protein
VNLIDTGPEPKARNPEATGVPAESSRSHFLNAKTCGAEWFSVNSLCAFKVVPHSFEFFGTERQQLRMNRFLMDWKRESDA